MNALDCDLSQGHATMQAVTGGSGAVRGIGTEVVEAMLLSGLVAGTVVLLQSRYGFNWGDEGLLWYLSQRTALGQVPIRDFFSYDPGRYYWSALVFKVLHGSGLFEQIEANAAFGFLGLVAACIAASRALTRSWRIALLLILGIMLGFPRHKIYEQTLSLVAVAGIAFILAKPTDFRRWFFYGLATGLAGFIGRNSGVYYIVAALLALTMLRLRRREISIGRSLTGLFTGAVVGYIPMLFMVFRVRGFASAFYQSVLFTPNWELKVPIPFPWHVHLQGLHGMDLLHTRAVSILCLAMPIAYVVVILAWLKSGAIWDSARTLACAASIAGIPYLHHAFSRADFFHIAQGSLPFAVVLVAFAGNFWRAHRRWLSLGLSAGLLLLVLAAWLPYEPLVQYLRMKAQDPQSVVQMEIDGRDFYVATAQAKVMRAVETALRSCGGRDGSFLAIPYYPGLYALLRTRAPFWELYYVYPRDDAFQQKHIEALQQNRVSLVLVNQEATVDGVERLKIDRTYPKLVDYILAHYDRSEAKLPDGFELYYSLDKCDGRTPGQ